MRGRDLGLLLLGLYACSGQKPSEGDPTGNTDQGEEVGDSDLEEIVDTSLPKGDSGKTEDSDSAYQNMCVRTEPTSTVGCVNFSTYPDCFAIDPGVGMGNPTYDGFFVVDSNGSGTDVAALTSISSHFEMSDGTDIISPYGSQLDSDLTPHRDCAARYNIITIGPPDDGSGAPGNNNSVNAMATAVGASYHQPAEREAVLELLQSPTGPASMFLVYGNSPDEARGAGEVVGHRADDIRALGGTRILVTFPGEENPWEIYDQATLKNF